MGRFIIPPVNFRSEIVLPGLDSRQRGAAKSHEAVKDQLTRLAGNLYQPREELHIFDGRVAKPLLAEHEEL